MNSKNNRMLDVSVIRGVTNCDLILHISFFHYWCQNRALSLMFLSYIRFSQIQAIYINHIKSHLVKFPQTDNKKWVPSKNFDYHLKLPLKVNTPSFIL